TIMGFIKGPVCRGQIALNVINDQFWVVFLDPDSVLVEKEEKVLEQESEDLDLPSQAESNAVPLNWLRYSRAHNRFLRHKIDFLNSVIPEQSGPALRSIWNGDGNNPNAALTIFRHFDNATVVQGFVGEPPKTAWVISYEVLERIHYLLVAGYDVYGNVGHQLMTRMYMDFLRMEGEFNFLAFLPQDARLYERMLWYRNVSDDVAQYVYGSHYQLDRESAIPFKTDQPKLEMFGFLRAYLGPALSQRWTLKPINELSASAQQALQSLQHLTGRELALLPQLALLSVDINGQRKIFTIVHNTGHANVSTLLFETDRRIPEEDTISLVPGILGAYPNAFFDVTAEQLPDFVAAIARLDSEADYRQLVDRYGVRRNSAQFWPYSDWLNGQLQQQSKVEAGMLDYNRIENR
ncbi:MAG TPA: fatty acid cis/trans isomerase, partial [Spongiibacteraceae bacterium]|nr:fatty acid cis/trans isomerase [Spongiibacteraceae bacterium]